MSTSQAIAEQDIIWQPNPGPQDEFFRRTEFEVFYGGAAGGGKTDALLIDGLRQISDPHYKAVVFRRTFPELQEHMDRSQEIFPRIAPGARWNEQKKRWKFPSGATYRFAHMQNETDRYDYQGDEYQYIGFDELTHFTEIQYLYLLSRCRTSQKELKCYVRSASNPGNVGHVWVKKRFKIPSSEFKTIKHGKLSRCFIPAKVQDNPYIYKNDPEYIDRLKALPEQERKMLLEGNWDVFAGQAFPEWNPEIHVIEPFAIPPEWARFWSYDYGKEKPFCTLFFAIDWDGNVYVYREIYQAGLDVEAQVKRIEKVIFEYERDDIIYADPSIWSSVGIRKKVAPGKWGESIGEIMQLMGLSLTPADNNRLSGKAQVHRYLQSGKLKIFRNCIHLIETLPALPLDDKKPEDVNTDAEDHAYDALRYGLMSRPKPGLNPEVEKAKLKEPTIEEKCAKVIQQRRDYAGYDEDSLED